jgi:hypothetical protein
MAPPDTGEPAGRSHFQRKDQTMPFNRRQLLAAQAIAVPALLGTSAYAQTGSPVASPEAETTATMAKLEEQIRILSFNTASGGGVNLKLMPDPETMEPTVELPEVFSFDRTYAFCRVDTNPEAFVMPTFAMGEVLIEPNTFYMAMEATVIDQFEITTNADGSRTAVLVGGLSCKTEVAQSTTTIGSRTVGEHATYRIEAVDAGVGGGAVGDRFAFTVFFDEAEAPINYAMFGPEFTFTGTMTIGEINIIDPNAL